MIFLSNTMADSPTLETVRRTAYLDSSPPIFSGP